MEHLADARHEHENTHKAVDDRRDGDVEVRCRAHDVLEPDRSDLREEDGTEQAERRADEHGENGRHQRADDERERAELAERHEKGSRNEEIPPALVVE